MAGPAAIALFGVAALQMAGGYFAAENVKETAKLNQDIADMNAEFAELDAYDAEIEGYSTIARYQNVIDTISAQQTVAYAASNVDVNYGTAADIRSETEVTAELNKMEIEKQFEERALGYEQQARQYVLSGSLGNIQAQEQASQIKLSSLAQGISTGASGYRRTK